MASCSQVSSLLQAYIDGELGNAEKSILEQHLRECDACRVELSEQNACTAQIYEALSSQRLKHSIRTGVLDHLPEMDPAPKLGSHPTDPEMARRKQRAPFPRAVFGLAALFAIFAAVVVYQFTRETPVLLPAVGMVTFSEPVGVLSKLPGERTFKAAPLKSLVTPGELFQTLENGRLGISLISDSVVKANYNSSVTIRDNRQVTVGQGLTFFDVGHDSRLFNVTTPSGEILVFGTAFVVDVKGNQTTLTVSDGDVLVSNHLGKTGVSKGNQLTFTSDEPLAKPLPVVLAPILAWADDIVLDPEAVALFEQTLELRRSNQITIPAVPINLNWNLKNERVEEVILEWTPDGLTSGHCGYIVHVADSNGVLLLIDTLDGALFNDPLRSEARFAFPDGPLTGIDVIHTKLVPDHTDGNIETDIKVFMAVGNK